VYERALVPLDGSPLAESIIPFILEIAGPLGPAGPPPPRGVAAFKRFPLTLPSPPEGERGWGSYKKRVGL
jgi:hypothetical protein